MGKISSGTSGSPSKAKKPNGMLADLARHQQLEAKASNLKKQKKTSSSSNVVGPTSKQSKVGAVDIRNKVAEIDDLFGDLMSKQRRAKANKLDAEEAAAEEKKAKRKKMSPDDDKDDDATGSSSYGLIASKNMVCGPIVNPEAPIHRWDAESGLPVYKAALLKVGDGGGTPLCPVD